MASPLLETKFHAPRPRRGLVARPLLKERLDRGVRSRLTLISAPAGFGKSTLLAEWLAATPPSGSLTAWLSLDPADDDPVTFWANVIAALRVVAPGVGAKTLAALETPDPSVEAVLAPLLNDLHALTADVVLVFDDFHLTGADEIQRGVEFALEHLPPNVHLVLTTRADPALPLARLRAHGELVEIRAADLRFSRDEASAYLNGVMALGLAADDVATLEARTEGWIAALQLAGLTMQGRDDTAGFIAGFAGDDRYIVDYLVEEVWQDQPDDVRRFLLRTSILTRMCGSLCDAVTGQTGGKVTLETLDRRNLFVIPLDDRRRWYRYHHLFADVLHARLLDEQPELVPELHRRAADWLIQEGEPDEAIRHAIAGQDFAHAADLVELAIPAMGRDRRESTMRRWLEAIPDDLIRARPVLSDGVAGSLLVRGETDGVDGRLSDAERWLELTADALASGGPRPATMVVVDETAFRRLPASIAIHRAGLARFLGDDAATVTYARRALDLVDADEHLGSGAAGALLGLAQWAVGDLEAAKRSYVDAMASLERAGHLSDTLGLSLALADIQIAQGHLHDAASTYERGLLLSSRQGVPVLRGAADMHVGLSSLAYERNDVSTSASHLRASADLGEDNGLPQNAYRWLVAMARIRQAEGDLDGAIGLLDEAQRRYFGDFAPDVRPVAATRARVLVMAGRHAEALAWVRERGLSTADDLSYAHEYEHGTLARVLLGQGEQVVAERTADDLRTFIARLLTAAGDGRRIGSVIDLLVVEALMQHASGDTDAAVASLRRAVDLAEPEGYIRVFVDEGPPMAALLKVAAKRQPSRHLRRILNAAGGSPVRMPQDQPLVEPLSGRELEVLRLLGGDLDGPGIARELGLSLATVRTHTRNIYAKLDVTDRRAAVRRAAELGMLSEGFGRRPTP